MKIQGPPQSPRIAPRISVAAARRDSGRGSEPPGEAVFVSRTARLLAAARAPETPDGARVERLRRLVADDGLPVDVDRIIDAILAEER
jgi:hypothetical protein